MTENLHPSQLHHYILMYQRAKLASWGCLASSILLLSLGASLRFEVKQYKPWVFGASVASLAVGRSQRRTVKQLAVVLGDIDQISAISFQSWLRTKMQPTAPMVVNVVGELPNGYTPDNLVTEPVTYIQQKQKHVALIGGTGDGKSTFTQYLSALIGGRVMVYDSDAKPEDWSWLDQNDVVGRKGNFKAIDTAMGLDLEILSELVQLRGGEGDKVLTGRERFLIAEEFPVLVDECDNAVNWLKKHAKRGRRYKQFILAIAQNDTAENFGLQGDKDTLYSCFCLVRLGQFAYDHARTKLKDPRLEQWLKAGGKKRFMVDDLPCELDLSTWGMTLLQPQLPPVDNVDKNVDRLNEYETAILDWGKSHSGEILKARTLQQNSRLFADMAAEDIRIIFASLADRKLGEVVGTGDRMGWMWVQPSD